MPDRIQTFSAAVHGALAMELAKLVLSEEAFENFWRKPRRSGLATAMRVMANGVVAMWLSGRAAAPDESATRIAN